MDKIVLYVFLATLVFIIAVIQLIIILLVKNKSNKAELLRDIAQIITETGKTNMDYIMSHTMETIDRFTHAIQSMRDIIQQSKVAQENGNNYITKYMQDVIKTQQDVQKETIKLSNALSNPVARGKWGEIQLRRIVELSGMMEHCDFETQVYGEKVRPDMVINLPNNRKIIVDAKVPFSNYMEALEKNNDEYIQKHRDNINAHVNMLYKKSYWKEFSESPEFVIMFIPSESFLSIAVGSDCSLLEEAAKKNVIIATPMILLATLKSICYSWRQETIHRNLQEITNVSICIGNSLKDMLQQMDSCENRILKAEEEYRKLRKLVDKNIFGNIKKLGNLLSCI